MLDDGGRCEAYCTQESEYECRVASASTTRRRGGDVWRSRALLDDAAVAAADGAAKDALMDEYRAILDDRVQREG